MTPHIQSRNLSVSTTSSTCCSPACEDNSVCVRVRKGKGGEGGREDERGKGEEEGRGEERGKRR